MYIVCPFVKTNLDILHIVHSVFLAANLSKNIQMFLNIIGQN